MPPSLILDLCFDTRAMMAAAPSVSPSCSAHAYMPSSPRCDTTIGFPTRGTAVGTHSLHVRVECTRPVIVAFQLGEAGSPLGPVQVEHVAESELVPDDMAQLHPLVLCILALLEGLQSTTTVITCTKPRTPGTLVVAYADGASQVLLHPQQATLQPQENGAARILRQQRVHDCGGFGEVGGHVRGEE